MYRKCSVMGCEGPLIRHDNSGLCQGHKLSSGLSLWEAKQRVISFWRSVTGITPGMSREDALNLFIRFRDNPTCDRCAENKKIKGYCEGRFICEQADALTRVKEGEEEARDGQRNVERDGDRGRVDEVDGAERVRVSLSQERERVALR